MAAIFIGNVYAGHARRLRPLLVWLCGGEWTTGCRASRVKGVAGGSVRRSGLLIAIYDRVNVALMLSPGNETKGLPRSGTIKKPLLCGLLVVYRCVAAIVGEG